MKNDFSLCFGLVVASLKSSSCIIDNCVNAHQLLDCSTPPYADVTTAITKFMRTITVKIVKSIHIICKKCHITFSSPVSCTMSKFAPLVAWSNWLKMIPNNVNEEF